MSFASRRSVAAAAAALAVAGTGTALVVDSGRAQDAGTTYTITYGKSDGALNDLAPKGIGRGRASVGDQFFITNAIRRNDGVRGRLQATYIVGQKKVALVNSRGHALRRVSLRRRRDLRRGRRHLRRHRRRPRGDRRRDRRLRRRARDAGLRQEEATSCTWCPDRR